MPRRGGPGRLWGIAVCLLAGAVALNLATPAIAAAALAAYLRGVLHTNAVRVGLAVWPPPALWWGRVDRLTMTARNAIRAYVRQLATGT